MKTRENKLTLVIIILVSLLIGMSINWIFNSKVALVNGKQLIKEMTEGEYESKLDELNKSHEDYNKQVQANKKKLATAISSQKVATSENATIDEMVTNIGKILELSTNDATATAENIASGQTAYVNGALIIGNGKDIENAYNLGYSEGLAETNNSYEVVYTYHEHTGSSSGAGGCYVEETIKCTTVSIPYANQYYAPHSGDDDAWFMCRTHGVIRAMSGKEWVNAGRPATMSCNATDSTYVLGCGKTTETIESATIVFNK